MVFLNPSEWSTAVKAGVTAFGSIGAIIGMYLAVESWADEKISEAEIRQIKADAEQEVRSELAHDRIVQSNRISSSETNIAVVELQLALIEEEIDARTGDGLEPLASQERTRERLIALIEIYSQEQEDATKKLTAIHGESED